MIFDNNLLKIDLKLCTRPPRVENNKMAYKSIWSDSGAFWAPLIRFVLDRLQTRW